MTKEVKCDRLGCTASFTSYCSGSITTVWDLTLFRLEYHFCPSHRSEVETFISDFSGSRRTATLEECGKEKARTIFAPEDPGLKEITDKQFNFRERKYWLCECTSWHCTFPYKCPLKEQ